MLHHEQMNVYRVEHGHIVNEKAPVSHWEVDPPAGCPWCRDIPDDLIAVIEEVRIREEMKQYAKQQRRKPHGKPADTGD